MPDEYGRLTAEELGWQSNAANAADPNAMQALAPLSARPQPQALPQPPQGLQGYQNTLQQIMPMLAPIITGLGAAATTSRWAGPGAATARGLMGGLAGYAAIQPKPETARDRYYDSLAQDTASKRQVIERQMQNETAFAATLPEDQKALYLASPDKQKFLNQYMAHLQRPKMVDALEKYHQVNPEELEGLSDSGVAKVLEGYLTAEHQGAGKPTHVVEMIDGVPRTVFYDAQGNRIAIGGEARPTKGTAGPTSAQVQGAALDKYVKGGTLSDQEKRIVDKILQDPGTHATAETARWMRENPDEVDALLKKEKEANPSRWEKLKAYVAGVLSSEEPAKAPDRIEAARRQMADPAAAAGGAPAGAPAAQGQWKTKGEPGYTQYNQQQLAAIQAAIDKAPEGAPFSLGGQNYTKHNGNLVLDPAQPQQ